MSGTPSSSPLGGAFTSSSQYPPLFPPMTTTESGPPPPSAVTASPSSNGGATTNFYHNLFYILIAILGTFGIVSFLNLLRTRRRRDVIFREAERLGLMVPGMPGYVPLRDRAALLQIDGWRMPTWWEVVDATAARRADPSASDSKSVPKHPPPSAPPASPAPPTAAAAAVADRVLIGGGKQWGQNELPDLPDMHPLAVIPAPDAELEPEKPISPVPYFPNFVSYSKTLHDPRKRRFAADAAPEDAAADLASIVGEPVDVVVAIRMPARPIANPSADGDDDVMQEWGGLELGVTQFTVDGPTPQAR